MIGFYKMRLIDDEHFIQQVNDAIRVALAKCEQTNIEQTEMPDYPLRTSNNGED